MRNLSASDLPCTQCPTLRKTGFGVCPLLFIECFSYRADGWMAGVMRGEGQSSPRFRLYLYCRLAALVAAVLVPLWVYMR